MKPYSGVQLLLSCHTLAWQMVWRAWVTARNAQPSVQIRLRSQLEMVTTTIRKMLRTAAMRTPKLKRPCAHTAARKITQRTNVGQRIQARSPRGSRNDVPPKHPWQDHLPMSITTTSTTPMGMASSLAHMNASRFLSANIVLLWILILATTTAVIAAPSLLTTMDMIPNLEAMLSLGIVLTRETILSLGANPTLSLRTILVAVEDHTTTHSGFHPAARVSGWAQLFIAIRLFRSR